MAPACAPRSMASIVRAWSMCATHRCSPQRTLSRPRFATLHERSTAMKHVAFSGRLVMLGCGSIGQGVLPLILRHIDMPREHIHILTADARGSDVAAACGVGVTISPVTRENYRHLLTSLLGPGDFLLNLSVYVSSV